LGSKGGIQLAVTLLVISLLLPTISCKQKRPPWAEEFYPDYNKIEAAFREVAFEAIGVTSQQITYERQGKIDF
jgi:hypothetical protein